MYFFLILFVAISARDRNASDHGFSGGRNFFFSPTCLCPSLLPFLSLDPVKDGTGSSGSKAAYALAIAANTLLQTTITQGIALIGKSTTAAAERAVLTSIAKKYIKAAPSSAARRRRQLQASSTSTVDLTNSTVVADLLTQAIVTAQVSGAITGAVAATAQSSVAVVAAAVSNINTAVSSCRGPKRAFLIAVQSAGAAACFLEAAIPST